MTNIKIQMKRTEQHEFTLSEENLRAVLNLEDDDRDLEAILNEVVDTYRHAEVLADYCSNGNWVNTYDAEVEDANVVAEVTA